MFSVIFLLFAAFFKAVADTLQHHYDKSVFWKLNKNFWNPVVSAEHVKFLPWTKYRPDAWHLANTGMIVSFILFAVLYKPLIGWFFAVILGGIVFNLVFNLFYNKVLLK